MSHPLGIALIGDYSPEITAHRAIPGALEFAGATINRAVVGEWIGTDTINDDPAAQLASFDGVWCVPGSPYASMEGAIAAIRFAREGGRPFLGTCGGFQHALIEYARNVVGLADADHHETSPDAATPVITLLSCALVEATDDIRLHPGTRIHAIYGRDTITEQYRCRFGVNDAYRDQLFAGPLRITASDAEGDVRVMELTDHPFFIATLFQPERSSLRGETHLLVTAFVQAATETRRPEDKEARR